MEDLDTLKGQAEGGDAEAQSPSDLQGLHDAEAAVPAPAQSQGAGIVGTINGQEVTEDQWNESRAEDARFREFLCALLGVEAVYPYADQLSSINVHYAPRGRELGWHFDNSSFAVTTLLQEPESGGVFEYVPEVRDSEDGDMAFDVVEAVLNGAEDISQLNFDPGDLVLFRGRNALHRVTPTEGSVTRVLAVFAYNDEPGIGLSASALETFYGRTK